MRRTLHKPQWFTQNLKFGGRDFIAQQVNLTERDCQGVHLRFPVRFPCLTPAPGTRAHEGEKKLFGHSLEFLERRCFSFNVMFRWFQFSPTPSASTATWGRFFDALKRFEQATKILLSVISTLFSPLFVSLDSRWNCTQIANIESSACNYLPRSVMQTQWRTLVSANPHNFLQKIAHLLTCGNNFTS